MDRGKCDLTLEVLWKFHIWSQSIYPGEFEALFTSKGQDFHEVEVIFESLRSDILELLSYKICGDDENFKKTSALLQEKIMPVEKTLKEKQRVLMIIIFILPTLRQQQV